MLFLCFHVFLVFKYFCLGMKSRNKMKTKNCSGMVFLWQKKYWMYWLSSDPDLDIMTEFRSGFYCAYGMCQNFCSRNDSCNSKIWNLGTLENKGITFPKNFFLKEYHSCNKWWIRWPKLLPHSQWGILYYMDSCLSTCPSVHLSISQCSHALMTEQKRAENIHYQSKVFVCVSNNCADVVDRFLIDSLGFLYLHSTIMLNIIPV